MEVSETMQLHLDFNELDLLANLLMQHHGMANEKLLQMVLSRSVRFDCDELESLADLLASAKMSLRAAVLREAEGVRKAELQSRLTLLERVEEKVNEACAMI
jgi:hypothetical protein